MKKKLVWLVFLGFLASCGPKNAQSDQNGGGKQGTGLGGAIKISTLTIPSFGADLNAVLRSKNSQNLVIFLHEEDSNLHDADAINLQLADLDFDTLSVDLRIGANKFGFDNQTVKAIVENGETVDNSFTALVYDIHAAVQWGVQYSAIILTASSASGAAAIKEARVNFAVKKVAVFSPPAFFGGEKIYNYASQVFKPFFVAAPLSEKKNIDVLLSGTIPRYLVRSTEEAGDHGFGLLKDKVVLKEYLAFLANPL